MTVIRHGIVSQGGAVVPLIETDKSGIGVGYQFRDYSDYCAITVTPGTMSTTITAVDTGDGIFANIIPVAGTGGYSFRCRALSPDNGTSPRSMICRISDDAAEADDVDITLTQSAAPA